MAISYVGQGGAAAVTTSTAPADPAGLATNDLMILSVSSDGSAIGNAPVEWTEASSETAAGGLRMRQWFRFYDGNASGVTITATGGTKGEAHIVAYRSNSATLSVIAGTFATDIDSSSTAVNATGGSWASTTGDWMACTPAMLAPSGAYTSNSWGPALAQASATVSTTAQFAGRTGTNTVWYGHQSGAVTAGGTGAPSLTATAVGANAAGLAAMLLFQETAAPSVAPTLRIVRSNVRYG